MTADITFGVGHGEKSYRFEIEWGPLFMTESALDALAERDLAAYFNLIHEVPELWEQEWCCQPVKANVRKDGGGWLMRLFYRLRYWH